MKQRIILIALVIGVGAFFWMRRGGGPHDEWPIVNSPPSRPGIVCIGDSLTAGVGLNPNQVYTALLPGLLRISPNRIVARGVNGRTIGGALRDLDRDLQGADAGMAIILLGGNDQLRNGDVDRAMGDLSTMIDRIQQRGMMVAVCDFSPVPLLHGDWAQGFRRVAQEKGCVLVEGVADGLYGTGDTQASDGIHLNADGQRVMAERIAEAIEHHVD